MANVKVEKNRYTVDPLYQWDLNQVLQIYGLSLPSIPEIHFTNDAMDRAIVKQASMNAAGVITVDVPNSLLQKPYKITAYVCIYEGETFQSLYSIAIPVKARNKPNGYSFEDNNGDIYSFNALENKVENALALSLVNYEKANTNLETAKANYETAFANYNKATQALNNSTDNYDLAFENYTNAAAALENAKAEYDASLAEFKAYVDGKFAPAGYGLGENTAKALDANAINKTGFYVCDTNTPDNNWWYGIHVQYHSNYAYQEFCCYLGTASHVFRKKVAGTWSEWEWVNPPMTAGVEYRTTERYKGKAVYTKLINFGYLPNATKSAIANNVGATLVIRCEGVTSSGYTLPYNYNGTIIELCADLGWIMITTNKDYSTTTADIQLWYTKD